MHMQTAAFWFGLLQVLPLSSGMSRMAHCICFVKLSRCKYKVRSYKGGPNVSSVFYSASCTASRKGQLSFGTRAESDSLLRRGSCRASGWRSGHPSREPSARRPPPHRATRSTMGCSRGQDSIPRRQLTAFV
ncbi:hypothetical protein MTO96_004696 [Rhipicephalus appendiculatus]